MAIQDKDDIGEGEEDPIEVRILDCLSRIESINEQLQTPGLMAQSRRMDREDLAGWVIRARDAKQHTIEELVRLRYLLRQEERGKDREIAELKRKNFHLQQQNIQLDKEATLLRGKMQGLDTLELSDEVIDRLAQSAWGHKALVQKNKKLREEITSLQTAFQKKKVEKVLEDREDDSRKESEQLLRETVADLRQQLRDLANDRDKWARRASGVEAAESEEVLTKKTFLSKLWDQWLEGEVAILVPSRSRHYLAFTMAGIPESHRTAWNQAQIDRGYPPARTYTPPTKKEDLT